VQIIPFELSSINKTIWAIIPTENSDAAKNGYGLMFMLCSRVCTDELADVLKIEREIGDMIFSKLN